MDTTTTFQAQEQDEDEDKESPPSVPAFDASVLLAKAPVSLHVKDKPQSSEVFMNLLILLELKVMLPFITEVSSSVPASCCCLRRGSSRQC